MKPNTKGFSLIELMVVVAIIGILSSIGIPQFKKFQARARMAEAKVHLSTIYTGSVGFHVEWGVYTFSMRLIGASAVGTNLRYDAGFPRGNTMPACTPPPGTPPAVNTESRISDVAPAGTSWYTGSNNRRVNQVILDATLVPGYWGCDNATQTFKAAAWGAPMNGPVYSDDYDTWTIDQNKAISYVHSQVWAN